jgi:hypothetical protein
MKQAKHETDIDWARAPMCFSCGKEIGTSPEDVIYLGYGRRPDGEGPGWVASLCSCDTTGIDDTAPSPCVEAAQVFAAEDGAPLSPEQYRHWLSGA